MTRARERARSWWRSSLAGWVVCLALPAAAVAAPETTDETAETPRVAYFGVEATESAARDAAAFWSLSTGATPGETPRHLRDGLPTGASLVDGSGPAEHCEGAQVSADNYTAKLDELYAASQDLQETAGLVADVMAAQPCLDAVVPAADLAYPSFMVGVDSFDEADRSGCEEAFGDVFALDLAYPWDHDYHPLVHDCFSNAKAELVGQPRGQVSLWRAEGAEAWLDGQPWDAASDSLEVLPGRHLLQISGASGSRVLGVAFHVEPGEELTFVDPAVLDQPPDEAVMALLPAILSAIEAADATGVPDVLISMDSTRPSPWQWDRESGSMVVWKPDPRVLRERRKARIHPAVPVLLGVGATMLASGAVMTAVSQGELDTIREEVEAGRAPMAEADDPDASDAQLATREQWDSNAAVRAAGIGLMVGGGLSLGIAVPVGVIGAKKKQEVSISAGASVPVGGHVSASELAVGLTVHIR